MHEGVDVLEAAVSTTDPVELCGVAHKALSSALTVIARADDSSGIIGDACRRLLRLHPRLAAAAQVQPGRLVSWMMAFQFDNEVDYFELDPVAYAPALGESGLASYRARLAEVERPLGPRPVDRWDSDHRRERFVLEWNAQRLAVLDHDIDAIIATHARDRRVAARLEDTAKALEEIGEHDLAIDWARQATFFNHGHQSLAAGGYWCRLLALHRPAELLAARLDVFRRWPSSTTAAAMYDDAGSEWSSYRDEVSATLAASPRDAVLFTLRTLNDVRSAWDLAHTLGLDADDVWDRLAAAYATVDQVAVLPVHAQLVDRELAVAGAKRYRTAARRLVTMRTLARGTDALAGVDRLIADLRRGNRNRPRLQQEFDRAGLP